MKPYVSDPDFTLYVGDVRDVLKTLPDESVHCVVTSPPYWGLRDYGTGEWEGGDAGCDHKKQQARDPHERKSSTLGGGTDAIRVQEEANVYRNLCGKCGATRVDRQLGLEPTPEEYVANMVEVFREVRRALRADGTCWVNLGDSYAGSWGAQSRDKAERRHVERGKTGNTAPEHLSGIQILAHPKRTHTGSLKNRPGLKPKDLVGIPWRVAFALQADGWYLRSDIIWSKPNPMPESVTDRPTKAHEYVFLLAKSPRYFFDQEAVRETWTSGRDDMREKGVRTGLAYLQQGDGAYSNHSIPGTGDHEAGDRGPGSRGPDGRRVTRVVGKEGSEQHRDGERWPNGGRNIRSVWEIATEPYPQAHFATFPQALVEPCIKAGTSERGCCPECGAPWMREVEVESSWRSRAENGATRGNLAPEDLVGAGTQRAVHGAGVSHDLDSRRREFKGWKPSCECLADVRLIAQTGKELVPVPVPCVVLDPFGGSGTTALVARKLGRRSVLIELNPAYAALAAERLSQLSLLAEPA